MRMQLAPNLLSRQSIIQYLCNLQTSMLAENNSQDVIVYLCYCESTYTICVSAASCRAADHVNTCSLRSLRGAIWVGRDRVMHIRNFRIWCEHLIDCWLLLRKSLGAREVSDAKQSNRD